MSHFDDLIIKSAEAFRLDANLIRAVCFVESSWNPEAIRFEPHWHYFNNPTSWADKLGIARETEVKNQATSFGLMQVMGAVARDLGFTDDLNMLKVPDIGVFYGCRKLQKLFQSRMCDGDEVKVIAAYNAGSPRKTPGGLYENQRYIDKIYSELNALRKLS